jgi:hypothetical protein
MDRALFTPDGPGQVREIIVEGRKDWAFIPDLLPEKWDVRVKLADFLIEEIVKIEGSLLCFFLNAASVVIKTPSGFGFLT